MRNLDIQRNDIPTKKKVVNEIFEVRQMKKWKVCMYTSRRDEMYFCFMRNWTWSMWSFTLIGSPTEVGFLANRNMVGWWIEGCDDQLWWELLRITNFRDKQAKLAGQSHHVAAVLRINPHWLWWLIFAVSAVFLTFFGKTAFLSTEVFLRYFITYTCHFDWKQINNI